MRRLSTPMTHFRPYAFLLLTVSLTLSGCLKTRAQLRHDEELDSSAPRPAEVREVQPKSEYVVEELKSEITQLTGRIEDLERAQKQQQADSEKNKADEGAQQKLEARIVELEQAQEQILVELKRLQGSSAASHKADGDSFAKAKKEFQAKNYSEAIDLLSVYLKNAKASLAEDATFLRAESYFATKQWKKAILDFSKFPEKYTSSKYMPIALSKIGQAFEAMGMPEDAKGFYQELIEKFPKSPEAAKARKKAQ